MTGGEMVWGWTPEQIKEIRKWMMNQEADVHDLAWMERATIDFKYWPRMKIHTHLAEDFK